MISVLMKPTMKPLNLCLLLLLFLTCLSSCVSAQLWTTCSSQNYSRGSSYGLSLRELFSSLINSSSLSLFSNATSAGQDAFGMFQCRGDISLPDCFTCVNDTLTVTMSKTCPNSMGANVQQDNCHVRYDNNSALFNSNSPDTSLWFFMWNINQNDDSTYQNDVTNALQNVTSSAPANVNYYSSTQQGFVYALAQCDGYLSRSQCSTCLSPISDVLTHLNKSQGGRMYYGSCFYRYEAYLFFQTPSPPPPSPSPSLSPSPASLSPLPPPLLFNPTPILPLPSLSNFSNNSHSISTGVIVGGSVASIVLLGLFIWGLLFYCNQKRTTLHIQGSQTSDMRPVFREQVTNFSYEELRAATQDFHLDNKIGSGGFGLVYKGKLANGLEVAIKKLSANSSQGKREFMNEVSVITSVQHKNLIKLHGCCVEGSERLLVYEYLPNKSLDHFLFVDREDGEGNKVAYLDWNTRLAIILGTARGLAYLHQYSQVRIIHRDIKPSNILLDEDLSPKIADFGLAKLYSHDISHVTSNAAGTLGYLSPEYALRGQLTEKVDVYSFGVVTLEIISGRRNADLKQPLEKQRLLDWTWKCYEEGEQMQLLDPKLSTMNSPNPHKEEVIRVIHVALLCLQSFPIDRPSMTKVVQLLVGQSQILEIPSMPHYVLTRPLQEVNGNRFNTNSNTRLKPILPSTHDNNPLGTSNQASCSNVTGR